MKALEKDRKRRYDTPSGLAQDIRAHLTGTTVIAAPPSIWYQTRKFVRRNRIAIGAVGTAFTLMGAGAVGTTWGMRQAVLAKVAAEKERAAALTAKETAEQETYIARIALAQQSLADYRFAEARKHLETCPKHLRGWEWTYLFEESRTFSVDRGYRGELLGISDDGRFVALKNSRQTIELIDLQNLQGPVRITHNLKDGDSSLVRVYFAPLVRRLITEDSDGRFAIWDFSGRSIQWIELTDGIQPFNFCPNQKLLFTHFSSIIQVWTADGVPLNRKWNLPGDTDILGIKWAHKTDDFAVSYPGKVCLSSVSRPDRVIEIACSDDASCQYTDKDEWLLIQNKQIAQIYSLSGTMAGSISKSETSSDITFLSDAGVFYLTQTGDVSSTSFFSPQGLLLKTLPGAFVAATESYVLIQDSTSVRQYGLPGFTEMSSIDFEVEISDCNFEPGDPSIFVNLEDGHAELIDLSTTQRKTRFDQFRSDSSALRAPASPFIVESDSSATSIWDTDGRLCGTVLMPVRQSGYYSLSKDDLSGSHLLFVDDNVLIPQEKNDPPDSPRTTWAEMSGIEQVQIAQERASDTSRCAVAVQHLKQEYGLDLDSTGILRVKASPQAAAEVIAQGVSAVTSNSDYSRLVFAEHGGRTHVWDTRTWREICVLQPGEGQISNLYFSTADERLICEFDDGETVQLSTASGVERQRRRDEQLEKADLAEQQLQPLLASGDTFENIRNGLIDQRLLPELVPAEREYVLAMLTRAEVAFDRFVANRFAALVSRCPLPNVIAENIAQGSEGRLRKAMEKLSLEYQADPNDLRNFAWAIVAKVDTDSCAVTQALEAARLAVRLTERPRSSLLNTLGVALYRSADFDAAIETLKKADALSDRSTEENWAFLTMCYSRKLQEPEARAAFEKLSAITPEGPEIDGFRKEAVELFEKTFPKAQ